MSFDEELFTKVATLEARLELSQQKLHEMENTVKDLLNNIKELRSMISGVYEKS